MTTFQVVSVRFIRRYADPRVTRRRAVLSRNVLSALKRSNLPDVVANAGAGRAWRRLAVIGRARSASARRHQKAIFSARSRRGVSPTARVVVAGGGNRTQHYPHHVVPTGAVYEQRDAAATVGVDYTTRSGAEAGQMDGRRKLRFQRRPQRHDRLCYCPPPIDGINS